MRNAKYIYYFMIILILVALGIGAEIFNSEEKTPSLRANNGHEGYNLLAHWKQGDVIALVRHTERCDRSENECLEGNKGITIRGKNNAVKLGGYFGELLQLNTATIYNSPIKRTEQTAHYMFGELSENKHWLLKGKGCKINLFNDMLKNKRDRKNLILITHSTCMDKLGESKGLKLIYMNFDIDDIDTYGITVFFAVNKKLNQAYILGSLLLNEWDGFIRENQLTKKSTGRHLKPET